jgi:hypothetical protein
MAAILFERYPSGLRRRMIDHAARARHARRREIGSKITHPYLGFALEAELCEHPAADDKSFAYYSILA